MEVANIELCKELYELSGWIPQYGWYYYEVGGTRLEPVSEEHWGIDGEPGEDNVYLKGVAYDLGFLLRKLPNVYIATGTSRDKKDRPTVAEFGFGDQCVRGEADTPEDAVCKLAIELFKSGILTKGE